VKPEQHIQVVPNLQFSCTRRYHRGSSCHFFIGENTLSEQKIDLRAFSVVDDELNFLNLVLGTCKIAMKYHFAGYSLKKKRIRANENVAVLFKVTTVRCLEIA
jgi:hypothetical protein